MQNDSDTSARKKRIIGIECRSLEGPGWGVGRQARKLLEGIAARNDLKGRFQFILYSNGELPNDSLYDHELFTRRPIGPRSVLGTHLPSSFSIYYYVILPMRIWWDSLREGVTAVYFPNYMLPLIYPPHVKSMVMLTDDIFQEAHNKAIPLRYRIAYLVFSLFWAKRRATKIMAISYASASTLAQKGISPDRIAVNVLGVPTPRKEAGESAGIDFLFVGQAFERRRLKESLESFERIAHDQPEVTFRFIGIDKSPTAIIIPLIERINEKLGRQAVVRDEYVSDDELASAYASARTLVYVSDSEAFGMPPLEALSYGTPAVVADTALNREIYGDHAFFVPMPISQEGIEGAFRRSLDDAQERERIIAAGPSIVSRYSWQSHSDRFIDIMERLTA